MGFFKRNKQPLRLLLIRLYMIIVIIDMFLWLTRPDYLFFGETILSKVLLGLVAIPGVIGLICLIGYVLFILIQEIFGNLVKEIINNEKSR